MTFGRLVWLVTPVEERTFSKLWAPARWITLFFICFDLLSFVLQAIGLATSSIVLLVGLIYTTAMSHHFLYYLRPTTPRWPQMET